jgi:hypothetical protein
MTPFSIAELLFELAQGVGWFKIALSGNSRLFFLGYQPVDVGRIVTMPVKIGWLSVGELTVGRCFFGGSPLAQAHGPGAVQFLEACLPE